MTLKDIVCKLTGDQVKVWFKDLCEETGTFVYGVSLRPVSIERSKDEYTFRVNLELYASKDNFFANCGDTITIGGTVDDTYGVLPSWIQKDGKYIWFSAAKAREAFNISNFQLWD